MQLPHFLYPLNKFLLRSGIFVLLFFACTSSAHAASRFWVGGTGTWDNSTTTHWAATTNGAGGASVPGSGDTVTLDASSGGGTVTLNYAPNVTSITMGAFTGTFTDAGFGGTVQTFSGTGTGTRTLTLTGTWTITASSATVWTVTVITNGTFNLSTSTLNMTGTAVTFQSGAQTYGNVSFSGGANVAQISAAVFTSLTFTGIGAGDSAAMNGSYNAGNFTVTGNSASNVYTIKSASVGTTRVASLLSGTFTNAAWVDTSITVASTGSLTLTEALTLTAGGANVVSVTVSAANTTFNSAGFSVTASTFVSNSASTRTVTLTNSTLTLTGTGTVLNLATPTNISLTTTGSTVVVSNASASAKTLSGGSTQTWNDINVTGAGSGNVTFNASTWRDIVISAGSGTVDFTPSGTFTSRNVVFTSGFSGTWASTAGGTHKISGNLTVVTGMTVNNVSGVNPSIQFNGTSGTQVITSAGKTYGTIIAQDSPGAIVQLADDFTSTLTSFTLTSGTLDLNGKTLTVPTFLTSNSNIRVVAFGTNGSITLTGSGTVWSAATSTNLSTTGTGTIKLTDATATTKTFAGGGVTYPNVWLTGAGTGLFNFTGSNTFRDFKADTPPHTIQFTAGTTTTVSSFNVRGTPGALMTIGSITAASHTLVKSGGGRVSGDYLSISRSTATPTNRTWYACHSTNGGNNSGWIFGCPNQVKVYEDD